MTPCPRCCALEPHKDLDACLRSMRGEEPMHLIVGPLPVHLSNLLYNLEIAYMAAGLDQAQGVKARAAELLGMNRTTLVERLKRLKALQARQGGMVDAMREHLKGLNGERLPKRKDSAKVPFRG